MRRQIQRRSRGKTWYFTFGHAVQGVQDDAVLIVEAQINDVDSLHDVAQAPCRRVRPQPQWRIQNEAAHLAVLQVLGPCKRLHVGLFLHNNTGADSTVN